MSIIFPYRSKKKRKSSSKFLRNLFLVLLGCLVAYHYLDYVLPRTNEDFRSSNNQVDKYRNKHEDLQYIGNEIAAKIRPNVVIPLDMKGIDIKRAKRLPLLAASQPELTQKGLSNSKSNSADKTNQILRQVDRLVREHKMIQARNLLNESIRGRLGFADDALISKAIKIGAKTILSEYVYDSDSLASWYRVKRGDVMTRIAKKCKVPYKLICRINHIANPRRLRAGQKIKIVFGPIHGKVIMHKLMLYLYLQDTIIGGYRVGLGKNGKTPAGVWLVSDKVFKPVYCDPDTGKTYAPDDPDNPTGGYWIRLRGISGQAVGRTGFGIHGTNEPESIGRFMSKGCIRLRNEDVAKVFDMLKPNLSKIETIP